MAGPVKESLPGHSLKYQFVYLKIRLFKCSYRNMKLGSTLIWKTDATIGIGHITHIHFRLWYHGCSCLEWTRFQFQWTSKHGPIELRHVIQPKNQPEQVPRYWSYWSSHPPKINTPPILWLVGGLEPWNFMTFHSVGNVIIPTDEVHHFSEG